VAQALLESRRACFASAGSESTALVSTGGNAGLSSGKLRGLAFLADPTKSQDPSG